MHVRNDDTILSLGVGAIRARTLVSGNSHCVVLQDVLYGPAIMYNLVSISKMRRKGFRNTMSGADEEVGAGRFEIMHIETGFTKLLAVETYNDLNESVTETVFYNLAKLTYDTNARLRHRQLEHFRTKKLKSLHPKFVACRFETLKMLMIVHRVRQKRRIQDL